MKIHHQLASTAILLQIVACNRPGTDSHGEDIAVEEDGVRPDLPCGGADLQTDDFNCGACGSACEVLWPGTKYAAGGCANGQCGPIWSTDFGLPPPPESRTCEQMCALGNLACIPRGCSGMTAYVCGDIGDFGNQCDLGDPLNEAIYEISGECDEVIPYPEGLESEVFVNFACCCERP